MFIPNPDQSYIKEKCLAFAIEANDKSITLLEAATRFEEFFYTHPEAELTWKKLTDNGEHTKAEQVLVQCLATISSHPNFTELSPWEILHEMKHQAEQVAQLGKD